MRFPGYDLGPRLARSDVLDVHEAWSHERGCSVVLKTLRPDRRDDPSAVRALRREGALLRRLGHPHLVRAYDVLAEPQPAVVLETLGGETLAHLILRRDRRLAAREIGFLGAHLCSAVGYLHAQGHLHLDLKPSNVVADGGRAKLIDLSIARRPGRVKAGLGTWCYLSPEQALGGVVGPEADVWGIGVVLWEAATGTRAFGDDRDDEVDLPVLHRRADPVRSRRRLPAPLADVIDRCLEPDPAARPTLPQLVEACAVTSSGGPPRPAHPDPPAARRRGPAEAPLSR
jgi:serine/threonine protein kinase